MAFLPSKKEHLSLQPLSVDLLAKWLPSKEHNMRRGSRILQWRNPTNRISSRWWRSASAEMSHIDPVCPWCDMMGKATYLFSLLSKNPQMQHKGEKNMRLIRTEGHSTWPVLLKMAKVIKNKDGLRTCYSQGEPRETWLLYGMWDPGCDSGAEKE